MPQNTILQTLPPQTQPQALFPLNIPYIDDLFPGFAAGDFAVIHGTSSVQFLESLLCVKAQLPTQLGGLSSNVVFIDGGNSFRLYQVTRLAQLHQMDPKQTLDRIFVSRAFTAYQLTTLIMEKLKDAVHKYHAKLVVISDIAGSFLDQDVADEEARRVFSQVTAYLARFAQENGVIVVATYPPRHKSARNLYLHDLTCGRANVVLALRHTKYDREFVLEKHPRFTLGSAEYPSGNVTLNNFM